MGQDFPNLIMTVGEAVADFFAESYVVAAVKFFLFVYVSVLLVNIILLLVLRGFSYDFKVALYGRGDRPIVLRSQAIKRWENILSRLESDNESQHKVAVLEADAWAEELISALGYAGKTMSEKLVAVSQAQLESKDALLEAHAIRNRIIQEKDFSLTRDEAQQWLEQYKKFLDELEIF